MQLSSRLKKCHICHRNSNSTDGVDRLCEFYKLLSTTEQTVYLKWSSVYRSHLLETWKIKIKWIQSRFTLFQEVTNDSTVHTQPYWFRPLVCCVFGHDIWNKKSLQCFEVVCFGVWNFVEINKLNNYVGRNIK